MGRITWNQVIRGGNLELGRKDTSTLSDRTDEVRLSRGRAGGLVQRKFIEILSVIPMIRNSTFLIV